MANVYFQRQASPADIYSAAQADPRYIAGVASAQAANNANLGNFLEQARRAMISLGYIPAGFQDKYGILNDETRGLIRANTESGVSTYARLRHLRDRAIRTLRRQLSARGALRSGELGFGLNDIDLQNRQQTSDAFGNFFNQYGQLSGSYANAANSLLAQQQNLLNSIYGDLSQTPMFIQDSLQMPQIAATNVIRTANALQQNPYLFSGGSPAARQTSPAPAPTIYGGPTKKIADTYFSSGRIGP